MIENGARRRLARSRPSLNGLQIHHPSFNMSILSLLSLSKLYLQLYLLLRLLTYLKRITRNRRRTTPPPPAPSFTKHIPVKPNGFSKASTIPLIFYTPPTYKPRSAESAPPNASLYPLVITFHGGGFAMGSPRDDELFTSFLTAKGTVVVSIGCRLGPPHCYPTTHEDALDAAFWMWENSDEYWVDKGRTALVGFSAGGLLALTVSVML